MSGLRYSASAPSSDFPFPVSGLRYTAYAPSSGFSFPVSGLRYTASAYSSGFPLIQSIQILSDILYFSYLGAQEKEKYKFNWKYLLYE